MKFRVMTAAALVTLAALGSAGAADLPPPVYKAAALPPPPPVYNWTGCYVGGGGGYAFWQQDSFVTFNGTPITASQSNGGKGWFGQGQVGCDYQFTAPYFGVQTVIGAFGDFEGGSINGSSSFPGVTGSEGPLPGRLVVAPASWSRRAFSLTSTAATPKHASTA
jgi:outer membrane immunogenic protein